MIQVDSHSFHGLQQDLAISKQTPDILVDAHNIRITAHNDTTLLSITNEKGPEKLNTDTSIYGTALGYCVLNNYLVLFTTNNLTNGPDKIYKVAINSDAAVVTELYHGDLGFDIKHPIEAVGDFETDSIQKVYWTDGINQPRVINICKEYDSSWNGWFDFVPTLQLKEEVTVEKIEGGVGKFPSGVIQYAFTYYNKYGQETSIFHVTPLNYISPIDRGGRPDEVVSNNFKITLDNLDNHFEYIRIYSILRTSLDGAPRCKRLIDLQVPGDNKITYTDIGTTGEDVDPYSILYQSQLQKIKAETICIKDSTLFLGGITIQTPDIHSKDDDGNQIDFTQLNVTIDNYTKEVTPREISKEPYPYLNALNTQASGFKVGEYYRLGLQAQHETGVWSEPIFLSDYEIGKLEKDEEGNDIYFSKLPPPCITDDLKIQIPAISATIHSTSTIDQLINRGFKKVRPVVVFPETTDKTILFQGVLSPTVFTDSLRYGPGVTYGTNTKIEPENWWKQSQLFAQSSWFFRPIYYGKGESTATTWYDFFQDPTLNEGIGRSPFSLYENNQKQNFTWNNQLPYINGRSVNGDSVSADTATYKFNNVEIQGEFYRQNIFNVDTPYCTFHSPDFIFNEYLQNTPLYNYQIRFRGIAPIQCTLGALDLQLDTTTISSTGNSFKKQIQYKSFSKGIISGPFFEDYIVDDMKPIYAEEDSTEATSYRFRAYDRQKSSVKWMVYPWQKEGSLNNDIIRPDNSGTRSAVLKKKTLSNLRFSKSTRYAENVGTKGYQYFNVEYNFLTDLQMFNSNEVSVIKPNILVTVDNKGTKEKHGLYYQGNIDTLLIPDSYSSHYFAFGNDGEVEDGNQVNVFSYSNVETPYDKEINWMTYIYSIGLNSNDKVYPQRGLWPKTQWEAEHVDNANSSAVSLDAIGDYVPDLNITKEPVRMKYKSTPHIFVSLHNGSWARIMQKAITQELVDDGNSLQTSAAPWVAGLPIVEIYKEYNKDTFMGGQSKYTLNSHKWYPAGEAEDLMDNSGNTKTSVQMKYIWGDTWYGRYDCLKTYPFNTEDTNQIVEIASFMVESRVNLDGRYDRNRGQIDNTVMSPLNFNLFNSVYSQLDNFFVYNILDKDFYTQDSFPNQITWSTEKHPAQDVDSWTKVTLSSTFNMDGSKGKITALKTWKDNIICFQENEVSSVLFNSRVQIPVSDGVPIEITNGYKVDGKRTLLSNAGCLNKFAIQETQQSLYFIDSINKHLQSFSGEGIADLSEQRNMTNWFIQQNNNLSLPNDYTTRLFYDITKKDLYIVTGNESLCYNELLGQFVSFMNYNSLPAMFNIGTEFYCFNSNSNFIYQMFKGDYNKFFGNTVGYDFTFISNGKSNGGQDYSAINKVFDNIEFRGDILDDANQTTAECPINYIRIFNEYQDSGKVLFDNKTMRQKFRVWRGLLPRHKNSRSRIRNPWAKITLGNDNPETSKAIIHDVNIKYTI